MTTLEDEATVISKVQITLPVVLRAVLSAVSSASEVAQRHGLAIADAVLYGIDRDFDANSGHRMALTKDLRVCALRQNRRGCEAPQAVKRNAIKVRQRLKIKTMLQTRQVFKMERQMFALPRGFRSDHLPVAG